MGLKSWLLHSYFQLSKGVKKLIAPFSTSGEARGQKFGCFIVNVRWEKGLKNWLFYSQCHVSIGVKKLVAPFSTSGEHRGQNVGCSILNVS